VVRLRPLGLAGRAGLVAVDLPLGRVPARLVDLLLATLELLLGHRFPLVERRRRLVGALVRELSGLHPAAGLLSTFGAAAHAAAGLLSTFGAAAFLAAALLAAALLSFLAFLLPFGHSFPPWGWLVGTTF